MAKLARSLSVFALGTLLVVSCKQEDAGLDSARVPVASSGGASGAGGRRPGVTDPPGAGAGGLPAVVEDPTLCPTSLPGAKLIRIERTDGRAACIDQREVTQGEYHAFVAAVGIEGFKKLGYCARNWRDNDFPEPNWGSDDVLMHGHCKVGAYQPDKTPDAPVGCIPHCQAQSYCAWAGKELCGGFDDDKPLAPEDATNPQRSVWANACTNGGVTAGSHEAKEPDACGPDRSSGAAQTEAVTSYPACHGQGPYAEISGLSGGVAEWVNAGEPLFDDPNRSVGMKMGPVWGVPTATKPCGADQVGGMTWGVGFRCCKRLPQP